MDREPYYKCVDYPFSRMIACSSRNWVDLGAMQRRGSIEIRLHEGTLDRNKILTWAEFWSELSLWSDANYKIAACRESAKRIFEELNLSDKTRERVLSTVNV